jgi:hypothetical protein
MIQNAEWHESDSLTPLPLTHTHGEPGRFGLQYWPGLGLKPTCSSHGAMLRVSGDKDWWRCSACNIGAEWNRPIQVDEDDE